MLDEVLKEGLDASMNAELKKIFNESAKKLTKEPDIPEYLMCKITFEIMNQPVITQEGITYEMETLQNHFSANGLTDPYTRRVLRYADPVPNKNLEQAITDFLDKYPLAFEGVTETDPLRIEFQTKIISIDVSLVEVVCTLAKNVIVDFLL
eukprot:TRINITY_DN442_c0_g1_i10.p1 TRINITY_DN442_c0_g1~~TRINITY_DN442_c0_g1_i10.p1  ORF type:complete len:151 (+),score=7.87 TRINITY_DN442_c0_g1_i10:356-808(+)